MLRLTISFCFIYVTFSQPTPQHPPAHKFADQKEVHDQDHIKTHLDGQIDPTSQMSQEQLQFHYFKMHDNNNDNMLDGIELIKAITHWHGDEKSGNHVDGTPPPALTERELEDMIDNILRDDDYNGDGYIDYAEFVRSQTAR